MNTIIICGNLTKKPELNKYGDMQVARMTVAVAREYNQEKTDFFDVSVFGKSGENCVNYLDKGSKVLVRGEMQSTPIEKDGKKLTYWGVRADKVEFLSKNEKQTPKLEQTEMDGLPF